MGKFTYSEEDKSMTPIIFYAKPGKHEQKIKKLLKRWDVDFDFIEIQEGNPVIQIAGVLHEWPEFDRQEKLFKLIEDARQREQEQATKKKLKIKQKPPKDSYSLTLEGLARINVTLTRLFDSEPIIEIMKGWTDKEKEAGLILWVYATTLHETNIQILRDNVTEYVDKEVERIEKDMRKRGIARWHE